MNDQHTDFVELNIDGAIVRGPRAAVAAVLARVTANTADVYVTGGDSPRLPAGYPRPRVLEDACRAGALRGTPVPKSGWRITAEDLAAWEATRTRRRKRRNVATPQTTVDTATAADRELLAQVGAPRRAS